MKIDEKQKQIEKSIQAIMNIFKIKTTDSNVDTPTRVAKMLINELFIGLDEANFPKYKMFNITDNEASNAPIIVENINIFSICEHHFLPFIGQATFKYIPENQIIGLSKIPRIIDFLSRKPQLQEKLTTEIFRTFQQILKTDNISIKLTCKHLCASIRGIKDNCTMTTEKKGGIFQINKF